MDNIELNGKRILVTGAAGFIGSYLVKRLLQNTTNCTIVGIDNMNDYYDVNLKKFRLKEIEVTLQAPLRRGDVQSTVVSPPLKGDLEGPSSFTFIRGNIADRALIDRVFAEYQPHIVVNLAAQAGVRYSITNPDAYIESNLIGFYNILEACRHANDNANPNDNDKEGAAKVKVKVNVNVIVFVFVIVNVGVEHLVYASSSSVYGSNKKVPYSTDDKVDNPVSLYAATKKSNELLAHAYSKLYNIPSTGLRFFTVYGPAGRPDMAYFGFTNKLREGKTIQIFNYGNCKRDFTYVDDIVEGIQRVMQHAPEKQTGEDGLPIPPYKVYNIGNSSPENLLDFVTILQEELVRAGVLPADYDFEAHKELVPMQPGDVPITYADTTPLERDFGFRPSTVSPNGTPNFINKEEPPVIAL